MSALPESKVRCPYCKKDHIEERVKGTQVNRVYAIEDGQNIDGEIEEFVPDIGGTTFHCCDCGWVLTADELEVK
jgi:hypothetical protein